MVIFLLFFVFSLRSKGSGNSVEAKIALVTQERLVQNLEARVAPPRIHSVLQWLAAKQPDAQRGSPVLQKSKS